MDHGG
jgi:hypothetical protein